MVVTGIMMPGLDGIAATVRILARRPATRIVLVTIHADPAPAERGYAAGAMACVLKIDAPHELVPAVHAALRGERCASPRRRPAQG